MKNFFSKKLYSSILEGDINISIEKLVEVLDQIREDGFNVDKCCVCLSKPNLLLSLLTRIARQTQYNRSEMLMTYRTFLELVEIRTKLASLFPFIMGVLFAMTYFGEVQWLNTFIFFIGMTIFDMVTTMINNYMDLKKLNPKPINGRKYHWTVKHPTQACASSHFYHALDDDGNWHLFNQSKWLGIHVDRWDLLFGWRFLYLGAYSTLKDAFR
jgi:hypothetical protein